MHFLYIIHSKSVNKYYVGETTNVENRLILHKEGRFRRAFTKIAKDWEIVLKFECADRSEALFLESFIKRMKSKKFIEKIIDTPKILAEILSKHR